MRFPLRYVAVCLGLAVASVLGSAVGDTYQKVLDDNGQPKSQMSAGSLQLLVYPAFTIKLRDGVVVSISQSEAPSSSSPVPSSSPSPASPSAPAGSLYAPEPWTMTEAQLDAMSVHDQKEAYGSKLKWAIDKVSAIVNQAVSSVPLTPELGAGVWTAGWFHPGALRPDFANVDIRKTQKTDDYTKFPFITSNLNPGVAFPGDQVEFNSMTKFFYKDRNLPKKRLDESEMLEINRLYRIIAQCGAKMQVLSAQPP